jgi:hypothetical protein
MSAPTQSAPAVASTPPLGRTAQVTSGATNATNTATAAIARAEALAAARPVSVPVVSGPATPTIAAKPAAASVSVAAAAPAVIQSPAKEVHPWRAFFTEWPSQIPKRGILITRLNEASPFKAFMMRGDFLLIERVSPDSLGGRFLVIPFDEISTVKFTDPLKQPALEAAGFKGQLSQ